MKYSYYILLLVLTLTFSSKLMAQKQDNVYYDKNWKVINDSTKAFYYRTAVRTGLRYYFVKDYYINDTLQMIGIYTDRSYNFKVDTFKFYHENGKLAAVEYYIDNMLNGIYQTYYPNGQLKSNGFYNADDKTGSWSYYHENGQLASKGQKEKDKSVGPWLFYHDNGKLKSKGAYHRNKRDGEWLFYFPDGKLQAEMVYKKGKTQKSLSYFANGNKQSIGGYVNNNKQGTWLYFSPDGSEIFSGNYIGGLKIGKWIRKFRDSSEMVIDYSRGNPDINANSLVITGFSINEMEEASE